MALYLAGTVADVAAFISTMTAVEVKFFIVVKDTDFDNLIFI